MYEYFELDYRDLVFEWDEEKAESNFNKHGIRFEAASKVFAAEKMPIVCDEDCPEMTSDMLKQFHRTDMVMVKISPNNMKKVKAFGAD